MVCWKKILLLKDLDGSTFKNGKPEEDTDRISTAVAFLITNEGTFISHNI